MFDLRGKKGAWLNQYAVPELAEFIDRAGQVDYVILKYGFPAYEQQATNMHVPWLAEIYPYDSDPEKFANMLADQALQPGCVGAVVNMEYGADNNVAHWDTDNGVKTAAFFNAFRARTPLPLYASIDTRGNRPTMAYQKVLAALCDGVMPMVYPQEFQQDVDAAFASAITLMVHDAWHGKPIIPTIQTYNSISSTDVAREVLLALGSFDGVSAYTIGHATPDEWLAFVGTQAPTKPASQPAAPDPAAGLLALRVQWLETMSKLAVAGTADDVVAFATAWKNMGGK